MVTLFLTLWVTAPSIDDEAREAFELGLALAADGKYEPALEAFSVSRALMDRPSTVFNVGAMLFRLGRYREAVEELNIFLSRDQIEPVAAEHARRMISEAPEISPERTVVPPPPPPPPPTLQPNKIAEPVLEVPTYLDEPAEQQVPLPASSPPVVKSPWLWIGVAAATVGTAFVLGWSLRSQAAAPYAGSLGTVVEGLHAR